MPSPPRPGPSDRTDHNFSKKSYLRSFYVHHVKADEEFAIEKAKIVRQEGMNLDSQYEKKMKQVEVSQRM